MMSQITGEKMSKQTVELAGFQYEVDKICNVVDEGVELKDAIRTLHPTLPPKSIPKIVAKVKKHPYYIARKDLELNILAAKGPDLQQNLLDLAFNARSEMVRANTTVDALDRVYGKKDQQEADKPQFVFNFSFGDPTGKSAVPDKIVIESEQS